MELKDQLLSAHSKANCDAIVKWVGSKQERFDQLVGFFLSDDPVLSQRAAWPLSYAGIRFPTLVKKHFKKLVTNLQRSNLHDAIKRNTIRLLQEVELPEELTGTMMNICFDYINSPAEKPAIKAFSLTVLENMTIKYPEIKPELKTIIEDRWDYETAAFRARARKILKKLS
jgi:hypothetical protein